VKSIGGPPPEGDVMSSKFSAHKLALWLAAGAVVAIGLSTSADAKTKRYDDRGRVYYGPVDGPTNVVYQQGPRTRIYVSKRSWLDGGTEVNPGDRKFLDYAIPSPYGYPTFARENNNRPIDRQPLSTPSDVGGFPTAFPLPPY
jgi:hypothetical protein